MRQPGNPITTQIGRITTLPVLKRSQYSRPDKKSEVSSLSPNDDDDNAPPSRRTTTRRPACIRRPRIRGAGRPQASAQNKARVRTRQRQSPDQASRQRAIEGRATQNPSPQKLRAAFEGAGSSTTVDTASVSTHEDEEPTLETTEVSFTSQPRLSEAPVLFSAGAQDLPAPPQSFVSVATNLLTAAFSPLACPDQEPRSSLR